MGSSGNGAQAGYYYRQKMKDIDKLIKELREYGCRRTVDGT